MMLDFWKSIRGYSHSSGVNQMIDSQRKGLFACSTVFS